MALSRGQRLGAYEISAPLGAGGMGEVYRAKDTKLGREVAIKILPRQFSSDSTRLNRFVREARSASSLNHPNIITIHEIGWLDETSYIVMELVDGKTLRELLGNGPLPVRKVLFFGAQIAEGLAKAHAAGIVHRDLKPENVMISRDGFVKILDFGLAKLLPADGSINEEGEALTVSRTEPGVILGTVGYMSPEQASGQAIDFRSDQFSLGSILYEALTGKRAFQRSSTVETLSAVLRDEPDSIRALAPAAPGPLRWIIERCLAKSRDDRYASTKDLARDLATLQDHFAEVGTFAESVPGSQRVDGIRGSKKSLLVAWGTAALAVVIAALALQAYFRNNAKSEPTIRFHVSAPEKATFNFAGRDAGPVAMSPDGSRIAFVASTAEGRKRLFIRRLDSLSAQPLEGTDGASYPFWSPDSRYLGFFADGKLKKIDSFQGPSQTICDAPMGRGGAWNRDGVIVFAPSVYGSLNRVSADGGEVTRATELDNSSDELSHRWPSFLPDQRHFLYLGFRSVVAGQKSGHRAYVASLDDKEKRFLFEADSAVQYAWPGYLLFAREAGLLAIPFDKTLRVRGEARAIARHVQTYLNTASAIFSVSQNGVLTYEEGHTPAVSQLAWFDRTGKQIAAVGPQGDYEDPALSPDGQRVAVNQIDAQTGITNIWFHEISGNKASRFTFSVSFDHHGVWSPDQSRIVFDSQRKGPADLYEKTLHGTGSEQLLLHSEEEKTPLGFSPDGKFVVFQSSSPTTKWDLWILRLGDRKPVPFLQTANNEVGGQVSPNGRWLSYASDESGRWEVYVTSFPSPEGKWQVSTGGGTQPRWRPDGKELFYLSADRTLMSVEIRSGNGFESERVTPLFATRAKYTGTVAYDVSADGRFLINTIVSDEASPGLTVVLNWNTDFASSSVQRP